MKSLQFALLVCLAQQATTIRPQVSLPKGILRLRGGIGEAMDYDPIFNRAIEDGLEEYTKFGEGPRNLDMSSTAYEAKPTFFNESDNVMDGMGMWDFPPEYRLVGEHFCPRVGLRVRSSPILKRFWGKYNFTTLWDGWDHQSDRLGTIIGITDDGRTSEVEWDEHEEMPKSSDWYATGYLNNYFLSLAEDELQPKFEDIAAVSRIEQLEEELRLLRARAAAGGAGPEASGVGLPVERPPHAKIV